MVLVEDASALMTQVSGLILSIVALVGLAIKFAQSRTHNPRIVALETKMDTVTKDIGSAVDQVNSNKDQIMKGVAVADVLVPQLGKAASDHSSQIADLQKQLADIQAKVNLVASVVPAVTGVSTPLSPTPTTTTVTPTPTPAAAKTSESAV